MPGRVSSRCALLRNAMLNDMICQLRGEYTEHAMRCEIMQHSRIATLEPWKWMRGGSCRYLRKACKSRLGRKHIARLRCCRHSLALWAGLKVPVVPLSLTH